MNKHLDDEFNRYDFERLLAEAEESYGEISQRYLARCLDVTDATLAKFSRVFALRVDLHFACDIWGGGQDEPTCFQHTDAKVITRFFESLKSQLREEHRRKERVKKPSLFEYIWVREQDEGVYPHYHVILFFNRDEYAFLGNYREIGSQNMAMRIQRAWCSALSLSYPDYAGLVHFPDNPRYVFERNSSVSNSDEFSHFLFRMAYLAKVRTKLVGTKQRNFGCSQSRS